MVGNSLNYFQYHLPFTQSKDEEIINLLKINENSPRYWEGSYNLYSPSNNNFNLLEFTNSNISSSTASSTGIYILDNALDIKTPVINHLGISSSKKGISFFIINYEYDYDINNQITNYRLSKRRYKLGIERKIEFDNVMILSVGGSQEAFMYDGDINYFTFDLAQEYYGNNTILDMSITTIEDIINKESSINELNQRGTGPRFIERI